MESVNKITMLCVGREYMMTAESVSCNEMKK